VSPDRAGPGHFLATYTASVIDAVPTPETAPEVPPRTGRVWRTAALVVLSLVLVVLLGVVFFSALGLANEGVGSCGGG
jgi:hypothetical protein